MKKYLMITMFLVSSPALADQSAENDLKNAVMALQGQRNRAMDEAASAEAALAKDEARIKDMQKQIDDMNAKEPKK